MQWVETTGRSVEAAKEAALDELGVDESEAEFEVLEEARAGLFGRLRSEARVRARVKPAIPRSKDDRRDRRRRRSGGPATGSDGSASADRPASAESAPPPPARARGNRPANAADSATDVEPDDGSDPGRRRRRRRGPGNGAGEGGDPVGPTESAVEAAAAAGPETARAGSGGGTPDDSAVTTGTGARARRADPRSRGRRSEGRDDETDDTDEGAGMDVALEEQGRIAKEFVTDLVREFGLSPQVATSQPDEDTFELQLTGPDLGLLIGPKGATLLAIQDLTRTVVHHKTGANNGRIHVDVGGYRQKRTEALVRFAQQVASTVVESGNRTALEPMSAVDRKVVHDTISSIDGVSTVSEGEDPRRRVVILPGNG